MKNTKTKIIIWGADNYNTLGLLRSLGKFDFDILLLINGGKGCAASASKYCQKYQETYSIAEAVEYLVTTYPECNSSKNKAVLIPGGDAVSIGIAENYDVLCSRFHLMTTTDPQVIINVTDKNEMDRIAHQVGFLTPSSQEYKLGKRDISVTFPALLKPVHTEGRVEFKTKLFQTKEDLFKFDKYLNTKNTYILQQYVKKKYDIVVYGCRLPGGRTVLAGHHTLERWSDDGGGSYGHLFPELPECVDGNKIVHFLELIDYHGLFSAEFGYEDGVAYFYEFNLRNDGFCHLTYQLGANLPLLWVNECLNLGLTVPEKMSKPAVAINEVYDYINVLKGSISIKRYKADKLEAQAFHFYDPDDPQPYKNMHRRMWWELPFRAMLKKFRPYIVWTLAKLHK